MLKNPPIIGPIKSPMAKAKLFIAEEISFAVNISKFGSCLFIFLLNKIIPGINIGTSPPPIYTHPIIIIITILGKGGKGYTIRTPKEVKAKPKQLVPYNPNSFVILSKY